MEIVRQGQTMKRIVNAITQGECGLCSKPLVAGQFITSKKVYLPIFDIIDGEGIDTGKMSNFNEAIHWTCAEELS